MAEEGEKVYIEVLEVKRKVEGWAGMVWDVDDDKVLLNLAECQMEKWIAESAREVVCHRGNVMRHYTSDKDLAIKAKGLRMVSPMAHFQFRHR